MTRPDPFAIVRSKTDLTEEEISKLSSREAWALIYAGNRDIPRAKANETRLGICFTGFAAPDKIDLPNIAEQNGMKKFTSVPAKARFDLLVCGPTAGPKKIEKAKARGAQMLTKEQFLELVNTGALPE